MSSRDDRINRILKTWRYMSFLEKVKGFLLHPIAVWHIVLLDRADKKARQEFFNQIFND